MFKGAEAIWKEKQSGGAEIPIGELLSLLWKTGMGTARELHLRFGSNRCAFRTLRNCLERMVSIRWLVKCRVGNQNYYRVTIPPDYLSHFKEASEQPSPMAAQAAQCKERRSRTEIRNGIESPTRIEYKKKGARMVHPFCYMKRNIMILRLSPRLQKPEDG